MTEKAVHAIVSLACAAALATASGTALAREQAVPNTPARPTPGDCRGAAAMAYSTQKTGTENLGPLSRKALLYSATISCLVAKAKQPGFTSASWAPLADLVAVDEFVRVGNERERMNFPQMTEFLTRWATVTGFDKTLRRITEASNRVFVELEERNTTNGKTSIVNSMSVYEFNEAGKIRQLDIYLQRSPT